jgi:YHS domain-containing protein
MSLINKLYGENNGKIYYACNKHCPVCKEWKKPGQLWKFLEFFPYHCPGCFHAGYPEDFYIIAGNTFVCGECKQKFKVKMKNLFKNR